MGQLIPNQTLIYERANGVVYARYRDPPYNKTPRWIVGGDPAAVGLAQGDLITYAEWQELCQLAVTYPTLKKLLEKLVVTYYTLKESQ
jgi:hypothetical protein